MKYRASECKKLIPLREGSPEYIAGGTARETEADLGLATWGVVLVPPSFLLGVI